MTRGTKRLLELVASWPEEDIAKLEAAARAIENWRSEEYLAREDELRASSGAYRSGAPGAKP